MPRSFRFEPPVPRPGSLTRPRLLRALLGRWDHRVTTVVGGPGLGKTTLLAQALAENRLAPRGDDVWLGLAPGDAEGHPLARDALAALAAGTGAAARADADDREPDAAAVADAAWRRSPTAVCLVLDDVQVLAPDSPGALWLAELIDALPTNGHVVLAGRWAPAVPLARLAAQGALLRLSEDDLRFSEDELAGFAARRGVEAAQLDESGGWPAMAELAASVGRDLAGDYLWAEVLEPLGSERRRVLAVLSDLGGADDALAGAALGAPVDLDRMLGGVPLVAHGTGGWRVPHPLWATVKALALRDDERRAMRARAIDHLVGQHRYDDAITLATEAGLTDLVPAVLRAASIGPDRPPTRWLERWLADLPPEARGTPGAALATGVRAAAVNPSAAGPLREVVELCRTAGDVEGELSAIAVLGRVAWWRSDLALLGEIFPRVLELEAEGEPLAGAIAAVGRAVLADLDGDDEAVLAHLDGIGPGRLDDQWQAVADWLRASVLAGMGEADAAVAILEGIRRSPDPAFLLTVEGTRLTTRWSQGHVDEVVAVLPSIVERIRAAGVVHNLQVAVTQAAFAAAAVGDIESAERYLAEARQAQRDAGADTSPRLALAEAACLLARGDEPGAVAVIEAAAATAPDPDREPERRAWRNGLALTYVLVPALRPRWDAADLHGHLVVARRLAAAVVAEREGRGRLGELDLPDPQQVRAALPLRFAVELALGLEAAGRPEGCELLDALGPWGREAVRAMAADGAPRTRSARSLLAAVPPPPPSVTEVGVLGPLHVSRDGEAVTDGDIRRERVRELLAFLVGHRTTTRAALTTALWPDRDERAAANNLRVTTNYLKRLLEPWRAPNDPSYFVRGDGATVTLVTGDRLRIDADLFDDHLARAAQAEADGIPSLALEHSLAAVDLYRGQAHDGVADAEWVDVDRDHYRTRFVAAATRAGELLVGLGDVDRAEQVALRAVAADPWAEDAHGVLVAAALARGDGSAARRALDRSLAALADLGVDPSPRTQSLRRRVRGAGAAA
jgi:LuxR family maltose regulon positive regulatory protein